MTNKKDYYGINGYSICNLNLLNYYYSSLYLDKNFNKNLNRELKKIPPSSLTLLLVFDAKGGLSLFFIAILGRTSILRVRITIGKDMSETIHLRKIGLSIY